MIANGVDTIAVFVPLIAESEATYRLFLSLGFVAASLALAWLATRACTHPSAATPIARYGPKVAPFVMIGIGVYILLNTATDRL